MQRPRYLLLTTADASNMLGIAPRTVCLWAECSELPGMKIGRQWRFRPDEIAKWLENSRLHFSPTTPHLGVSPPLMPEV